ncbi:MAG: transposase [Aestuariivita sp.]|nr:transposase [Aestuariivita sp.]
MPWINTIYYEYNRKPSRYESDLTDEEWNVIEPLLLLPFLHDCQRTMDVREIVNAIHYVLVTGCQ